MTAFCSLELGPVGTRFGLLVLCGVRVCVIPPPSLWSGNLRLSLVLIPVRLVPAVSTEEAISFRQIHEPSGTPIKQVKGVRDGDTFTEVPEEEKVTSNKRTNSGLFFDAQNYAELGRALTGGEWPRELFQKHGVNYEPAEKTKSQLYQDFLPLINSRAVDLLDNDKLVSQLVSLERRTARGGRDSIDHAPGAHDDLANAVAGALVTAVTDSCYSAAQAARDNQMLKERYKLIARLIA
jgi:hypothetical protein